MLPSSSENANLVRDATDTEQAPHPELGELSVVRRVDLAAERDVAIGDLGRDRRGDVGIPASPPRDLLGDLSICELTRETDLNRQVVCDGLYTVDAFGSPYGGDPVRVRRHVAGEGYGTVLRGDTDVRRVDLWIPVELGSDSKPEGVVVGRRLHLCTAPS